MVSNKKRMAYTSKGRTVASTYTTIRELYNPRHEQSKTHNLNIPPEERNTGFQYGRNVELYPPHQLYRSDFEPEEVPLRTNINLIVQDRMEPKKKETVIETPPMPETVSQSDPKVWGPKYWYTFHMAAANYPIDASPITAKRMKGFLMAIPYILPCEACRIHASAYIEKHFDKMDDIVSGREKLFRFFVDMHNMVNARLNKPILSYEEAFKIYV